MLVENPKPIRKVHLDYYRAGTQCAITASYRATPAGPAVRGLDEAQSKVLIGKGVELARKTREVYLTKNPQAGTLLVAEPVGPYDAYLADGSKYHGDYHYSVEVPQAFHRPRVKALLDIGIDLLACEIPPDSSEIEALAELLIAHPRAQVWFSSTLRDSGHLSDSTPLRDVITLLAGHPQVAALDISCIAPEDTTAVLQHLYGLMALPLMMYPNSGEHYDAVSRIQHHHGEYCAQLADYLPQWQVADARLIGGCCRTTPVGIAALKAQS